MVKEKRSRVCYSFRIQWRASALKADLGDPLHIDRNYGNRHVLNNADRVRNCGEHYAVTSVVRTEHTRTYGKPRRLSGYSVRENSIECNTNSQIVCMLMI